MTAEITPFLNLFTPHLTITADETDLADSSSLLKHVPDVLHVSVGYAFVLAIYIVWTN